jgi:manganese/zinc/iron transport system permease protein
METLLQVLLLEDYNTRIVVVSTALLGAVCGLVGSLLLLRKRSLMGDAISHAMLPGIALSFLFQVWAGGSGKALGWLLLGALLSGLLGYATVVAIRRWTRIKDDAAMGIVLSVFFGLGVVLIGFVQAMPGGSAAGIEGFIYGKTASMVKADAWLLLGITGVATALCLALFKEFRLLCFDEAYAAALGWSAGWLDALMLGVVVVVTTAGIQAVGLILIIAFLIIPAAAARFWVERTLALFAVAAALGAISGWLGSATSALLPQAPAGAMIVLVAAGCFVVSLLLGSQRGVCLRWWRHWRLQQSIARQHILRGAYELIEQAEASQPASLDRAAPKPLRGRCVSEGLLQQRRSWSSTQFQRALRSAERAGYLDLDRRLGAIKLTEMGLARAERLTRNHRLWEYYLITHADVAASHVDRDADRIEHVLGEAMVRELEQGLWRSPGHASTGTGQMPPSPHPV